MEKEPQPESMSTVTIKPDYAPSEYSSEPPPAYVKPKSASVQVARIVAVTVIVTSIVLGGFILASAYVSANAACRQFEQELELLSEAADRLQPEALVQDEPSAHTKRSSPNSIDEDPKSGDDEDVSSSEDSSSDESSSSSSSGEEEPRSRFDLEQLASHLLEKNQKTKMNCVVEKKRAEEVVDHKPKTIRLPFGVNLTTDPRLEVRSGERMVIVCESGTVKSSQPPQASKTSEVVVDDDDSSSSSSSSSGDDQDVDEGDTIMIQPVMIPIPHTRYETHMNQRVQPQPQFMQIQIQPQQLQLQPEQVAQMQQQLQPQPQPQQVQPDFPPNPILRHIVQQIIAQKIMEAQRAREEQMIAQQQQQQQPQQPQEEIPVRLPHRFQVPPPQQQQQQPQPQQQPQQYAQRFPIPEEVLTQLNRLPNRDVIVAVSSESDSSEEGPSGPRTSSSEERPQQVQRMIPQEIRLMPHRIRVLAQEQPQEIPQEVRFVQEQRQGAAEVNGRQAYGRALPVQMMAQPEEPQPQQQQQLQQEQQVADEARPHFLQPRSVPLMEV